ncbi:protein ACCELERATED CELL DEATH 6-like [Triticum dicoccoides]|uniref:protein ACCELERATED CELL DEATH 6-like n=1 Tax=Triticum dicoccoides TaxID=85692 RepID=UPI00188F4ECD|nr:protein ACCELERATED CELL DEATH 6-like [Triticum dicoccoides]
MQDTEGNTALHLAIQARSFTMFCALLGNVEVKLNLTNNHGETPRDISQSKLPRGMGHGLNSENKICAALQSAGAKHGVCRQDKRQEMYTRRVKPEDEENESEKLRNAAQALIIASVLIATVAFSATFALPGGYRADGHTNGGTPTRAGSYVFDAFMMVTTLAFICSTIATGGFAFAAIPMVSLDSRRINLAISMLFLSRSVTCMAIAFALGVYMVLAPVATGTAVAACVIAPAVLLSVNMEIIIKFVILAPPLCNRIGLYPGIVQLVRMHVFLVVMALWPVIVTFGWAALARIQRHR